ncbi:MAG TPA: STAS domain-containing protein [Actinomycetota bacterium]|nr:STAS domain-containing protein [Actinomycetota bacterium]
MTVVTVTGLAGGRGLRIVGELDASNVFDLTERLEETVTGEGDVTLDLRDLRFIDSAGIHALIRAAKQLEGRGRMRLLVVPGPVLRVIELVGIRESLPHVDVETEER